MSYWQNKRVLVTGGAGFIGSAVTRALCERGARVRITTRSRSSLRNLPEYLSSLEVIEGDLLEKEVALKSVADEQVVFHLAALKKNAEYHRLHPATLIATNTELALNVLSACKQVGVERTLIMSSGVVSEDYNEKVFGYGWSKKIPEVIAEAYEREFGLKSVIVRPFNTYGPRDVFDPASAQVVPSLIRRIAARENPFKMFGDGTQERTFVYVEDLASEVLRLMEMNAPPRLTEFNGREVIAMTALAELIMSIENVTLPIVYEKEKGITSSITKSAVPESNNGTAGFVFEPRHTLREGLEKTIAWYKANSTSYLEAV